MTNHLRATIPISYRLDLGNRSRNLVEGRTRLGQRQDCFFAGCSECTPKTVASPQDAPAAICFECSFRLSRRLLCTWHRYRRLSTNHCTILPQIQGMVARYTSRGLWLPNPYPAWLRRPCKVPRLSVGCSSNQTRQRPHRTQHCSRIGREHNRR